MIDFELSDRSECSSQTPVGIPLITVLNYSGGTQSSALLWMLIRGDIERPNNLHILNADPGMEHRETYEYTEMMREEAGRAGIDFRTVPGPNLYDDLLNREGKTRIDNPAYFTQNDDGKEGRLRQKCTAYYKVAPMDREVRRILSKNHGIGHRVTPNIVEKWIGFALTSSRALVFPIRSIATFATR